MNTIRFFIHGAIWMACWMAALYFLKFWKKSGDKLFLLFALAFTMLGIERLVEALLDSREFEGYVIRLLAFILILVGIVQKNRSGR